MHEAEKLSLDQIEACLNASEEIRFEGENRGQVYGWVEQVLRQQQYPQQSRKARGLMRRYLQKMTDLSRAQVTRLIARFRANGELQTAYYRRHRFPQRYTRADIELLATVDEAHEAYSFNIGQQQNQSDLIIYPTLLYSTYLGGSSSESKVVILLFSS